MGRAQAECPACGRSSSQCRQGVPDREYGLPKVAQYTICGACGTVFQSPMPSESQLGSFYPTDYHSITGQGVLSGTRDHLRLRQLTKLTTVDGPLLDFGCGNGRFLFRAAQRAPGREYYGYEVSDHPEVVTPANAAVMLIRGNLETLLARLPQCATITMNHVIEHLPDPLATLSALRDKLAPGGILEGQTPAAGSLEHRVFGTRWSGYHAPRHTAIFSRGGLAELLKRSGYVDVKVRRAFNPAGLAVSLASLRQDESGGRIRRHGLAWLAYLGLGTLLAPIDLVGGSGIVNFSARRARDHD